MGGERQNENTTVKRGKVKKKEGRGGILNQWSHNEWNSIEVEESQVGVFQWSITWDLGKDKC